MVSKALFTEQAAAGWLVILPINRPQNMYYPWLHYVAPLLIGIGLLIKG